jgi:hypothetical protein
MYMGKPMTVSRSVHSFPGDLSNIYCFAEGVILLRIEGYFYLIFIWLMMHSIEFTEELRLPRSVETS